jgi:hypothetical protein
MTSEKNVAVVNAASIAGCIRGAPDFERRFFITTE